MSSLGTTVSRTMERYFEVMKYLFVCVPLLILGSCRQASDPDTPIVQRFIQAGGGDPHSADAGAIQAWFMQRESVRSQFDAPCAPLVAHYPTANWVDSAEGKICMAAGRAKRVTFKNDGSKF